VLVINTMDIHYKKIIIFSLLCILLGLFILWNLLLQPKAQTVNTDTKNIANDNKQSESIKTDFNKSTSSKKNQDANLLDENQIMLNQAVSDKEVGDRKFKELKNYPWLNKLPIDTEDIFIYFDTEKDIVVVIPNKKMDKEMSISLARPLLKEIGLSDQYLKNIVVEN
jgi:hypothetical protein